MGPSSDDSSLTPSESLFADWLSRHVSGEGEDFETFLDRHSAEAEKLRAHHRLWKDLMPVLGAGLSNDEGSDAPGTLFATWLSRRGAGSAQSLGELCESHPEHAEQLTELHERAERAQRVGGALARHLKDRFGSAVDPRVSLGSSDSSDADASAEVLSRLAGRGPLSERYQLEGQIGRGGMGAVLGVWDEDLRRRLAMKVMLSDEPGSDSGGASQTDPRMLSRFLEEAQVTGQLDHPGIVPVHELGLDTEGRVYFTMKLVKGETLKEVFERVAEDDEEWTLTRTLGLLLKVCEAMAYAHSKKVIHRDLKPANIMVGRYGETYVMDWGLAKVMGRKDRRDIRIQELSTTLTRIRTERQDIKGSDLDSPLLTMDGDVIGTPSYMSPEQAEGRIDDMGAHSDVYSLGAILYHLLTGQMPYVKSGQKVSHYTVWRWVLDGPPQPVESLNPAVPAELAAICSKAMERSLEARYPDMGHMAEDLRAYLEGRVVRAYETGAVAEFKKWVTRNRAVAASVAAGLLVAFGLLFWSNRAIRAEQTRTLQVTDLAWLDKLTEEAGTRLWPLHPDRVPAMEAWLRDAEELESRREEHRRRLESLASRSPADGSGDASAPFSALRVAEWTERQHQVLLTELVTKLEEFRSETGIVAEVESRRDRALSLGGIDQEAWQRAIESIASRDECPLYDGLVIRPQIGLQPLARNGEGLWEFAHVLSGEVQDVQGDEYEIGPENGIVLVLIPGGEFHMGSQFDNMANPNYDLDALVEWGPVHPVELGPFFLSKFEMTQAQWLGLTGSNPSHYAAETGELPELTGWLNPVERVNWDDCVQTLDRYGLTLPTEAQWEYAARAGTSTAWFTGSVKESLAGYANLADQSARAMGAQWPDIDDWPELDDGEPVHGVISGSRAPNPFGLFDVHGNVWEWCLDSYASYEEPPREGDGLRSDEQEAPRTLRGGSFNRTAGLARSAFRGSGSRSLAALDIGVRPARALDP